MSGMRRTDGKQTFALMRVSAEAYDEVAVQLKDAGYDAEMKQDGEGHGWLDMKGIALERGAKSVKVAALKTFRLTADCTFNADSIDDACRKLGDHLRSVGENGTDSTLLMAGGRIEIKPFQSSLDAMPGQQKVRDVAARHEQ